jgi:hypothetical protein
MAITPEGAPEVTLALPWLDVSAEDRRGKGDRWRCSSGTARYSTPVSIEILGS